ncbi:MAG: hypothetical protein RL266_2641 [Bacteroidota bacterium]
MGLSGLSVTDFMQRCVSIRTAIEDNVATFATPTPTMAELGAKITLLSERQTAVENVGGVDNTFLRNEAQTDLHNDMRTLAVYVEGVADGNADIILLSGFQLVGSKGNIGLLQPPNLLRRKADEVGEGKIYLSWNGVTLSIGYMVSIAPVVDGVIGAWSPSTKAKRLSHTFEQLVSGQLYAMRVATLSSAGQGDWSITVTYRPQ